MRFNHFFKFSNVVKITVIIGIYIQTLKNKVLAIK